MKKRAIPITALILLILLLIPTLAFAQAKPGAGMYFRLVTHGGNDPFWAVFQKGMIDAAAELGCRADIDLCGSDHGPPGQEIPGSRGHAPRWDLAGHKR